MNKFYLAPLQGLTDWIFRESFTRNIGNFDKTFTPFIRTQNGDFYRPSQCNDLLPDNNLLQKPIPQFLGKDAASFQHFEQLCVTQGYTEVNINMGCPYPMVTGKRMGAGLLPHPDLLSNMLDEIFGATSLKISVKCRLGLESPEEFEPLIPIFNRFPIEEMIIHPRIGKQQYKGEVDLTSFARYAEQLKQPICYNGDILSISDLDNVTRIAPTIDRFMLGRGILQNPFLLAELQQQTLTTDEKVNMLQGFHSSLIENSKKKYSGDLHFLKRFEEFWSYHSKSFDNGHKIYKLVKKCKTLAQYETVVFQAIKEIE
jgi:tRNA-dihydrouridine synthase B